MQQRGRGTGGPAEPGRPADSGGRPAASGNRSADSGGRPAGSGNRSADSGGRAAGRGRPPGPGGRAARAGGRAAGASGRPNQHGRDGNGAPAEPGWHGWAGNPDDLWPPFDDPSRVAGHSRADRRDQQVQHLFQDARRRPPQRQRLSREDIVDAAIAIADAEGAEALSMRRIAQVLRSGTMSLYWHVSSKERLLDLMRDALMAEVEVPEPSGDARADLRAFAISSRKMLRRHLWLMDFVGGRPPLGPTTMLAMDHALRMLESAAESYETRLQILESVNTYVSGAVLREAQEIRAQQAEHAASAEFGGDAARLQTEWRDRLDATGLFPNFVGFLDLGIDPDAPETLDARFEFGLDCLLDGVAARFGR
jgi:AcrR family transcriptional regulator